MTTSMDHLNENYGINMDSNFDFVYHLHYFCKTNNCVFKKVKIISGLFSLLELTGRLHQPEGNYILTFDCKGGLPHSPFLELFHQMSPNLILLGCFSKAQLTNICFPHGVFGFMRRVEEDRERFFK